MTSNENKAVLVDRHWVSFEFRAQESDVGSRQRSSGGRNSWNAVERRVGFETGDRSSRKLDNTCCKL